MKISTLIHIVICLLLMALVSQVVAQPQPEMLEDRRKLGQTGLQFLTVPVDARAAALAGAVTAHEGSSMSLFYNPAGMAGLENLAHVSVAQSKWIADINYNQASAAFQPFNGRYGVIGLSFLAVDYGTLQETIRYDNESGYLDIGTYSPTALSIGLGYATALTTMFSVGGQVKYVSQDLGKSTMGITTGTGGGESYDRQENTVSVVAFDFGIIYKTGYKSLNFAMDVRNFAKDLTYEREEFQLPLTFQVGVAMDMMDFTSMDKEVHSLLLSVDASHPRSYSEQLKIGVEYTLVQMLALRAGYRFPTDEPEVNFGVGVKQQLGGIGFGLDYGYSDFGIFGSIQRIAAQFSF